MHTFLDQCPKCHHADVRVEFVYDEGYAATRLEPGEGAGVSEITCCTCNERLDEDEDVSAACLEQVRAEIEFACYPDI